MADKAKTGWIAQSGVQGVRYREHPTRKFLRKPDRYFAIRRKHSFPDETGHVVQRQIEEGVGWASEGYTPESVRAIRAQLLQRSQEMGRVYTLAELRSAHAEHEHDTALRGLIRQQQHVTVATAARIYLAWAEVSKPKSWRTEASRFRVHILPLLGEYRLADVTPVLIEALRTRMTRSGLSVSSVRQTVLAVSALFQQCRLLPLREDVPQVPVWSGGNPAAEIRVGVATAARWRIISDEDMGRILAASQDLRVLQTRKRYATVNHHLAFHDIILFARRTGVRLSEACGLRWVHVDLERNAIRLTDTKNWDDRVVHADADILAMLRRRSAHDPDETHVFWDSNRPMDPDRLSHAFSLITEHLGLNAGFSRAQDRIVFHSLRHTYATRAIMDGMNPMVLRRLMGHSSLTTTERYVHLAEEFMRGQVTG